MTYIFLCPDSVDGILTAVYDAFASGYGHKNIHLVLQTDYNYNLFQETISVRSDSEKAEKVHRTLESRLGSLFYETIWEAASADSREDKLPLSKPDAVYQTIVMALSLPEGARVLEYLKEPCIHTIFTLARGAHRESHHLLGFLRFQELENGILFARMYPKNQVLHIVAEHFSDRFPLENFIIYDEHHGSAAIHKAGASVPYFLVDASILPMEQLTRLSPSEEEFQMLWCTFFEHIGIKDRSNPKLQSQLLPKRYWKYTVELNAK